MDLKVDFFENLVIGHRFVFKHEFQDPLGCRPVYAIYTKVSNTQYKLVDVGHVLYDDRKKKNFPKIRGFPYEWCEVIQIPDGPLSDDCIRSLLASIKTSDTSVR